MTLREFQQQVDKLNQVDKNNTFAYSPIDNGTIEVNDINNGGTVKVYLSAGKLRTLKDDVDPRLYSLCFQLAHSDNR